MGIDPDILTPEGWQAALAALDWQLDMGVDEAIGDEGVDRYALAEAVKPAPRAAAVSAPALAQAADPVAVAKAVAEAAGSLEALAEAIAGFDLCDLKRGAKSTVFADGNPRARVMILGEAPGREEDQEGRPFVGRAGQLLDRMFAAIGLGRSSPDPATALYITNVMPWRPPNNREPEPGEIAMMRPFLQRHVDLVDPDVLVLMGNTPCDAVLGARGILRLRGKWTTGWGRKVMPMTHPAYLLRNPLAKREAWADLLAIRERLEG